MKLDIVKRAYLRVKEDTPRTPELAEFHNDVTIEVMRLIRMRVYSGRDWPREYGPMPDELRKRGRATTPACSEENPCCDRRGEYNGFASGPLSFICPKHCRCHD